MPNAGLHARALAGKTLRGTGRHGHPLHVVEEVGHERGVVLWQPAVAAKRNDIPLVPRLLAQRSLRGIRYPMDALNSQGETAPRILDQEGHSVMVIKKNHRHLDETLWFADEAWPEERAEVVHPCDTGHGRHEHRTGERRSTWPLLPLWPGMHPAMKRVTEPWDDKTGRDHRETTYALTSLPIALAAARDLERYWRGHWTSENKVHDVRDVACQEDACQVAKRNASLVLAAWRNGRLNHFRLVGTINIAAALRQRGDQVHRALEFVGLRL